MKAIIEIEMDNAAFGHGTETALELSQVLSRLGDNCERYLVSEVGHSATATDMNGNYVAKLEIVEEDDWREGLSEDKIGKLENMARDDMEVEND
tara:strand:+ start:791 stop:1072 length:282 start_codon:yes stop_codon:yes gene_type:complete